jgi:hypothetical protein
LFPERRFGFLKERNFGGFSICLIVFLDGKTIFPSRKTIFTLPEMIFRRGKMIFPRPETIFRRGKVIFRRPEIVFPPPEMIFRRRKQQNFLLYQALCTKLIQKGDSPYG